MATAAVPTTLSTPPWTQRLWLDLQPTPGRLSASLRILLASILTLILLLVWQVPFASIGLYFVFLVGRDSPSVSLRSGMMSMLTLVAAVATELGVVALSDNDPMARLIGVAVVSFLAGSMVVASNFPTLASTWGFIFCTLIALWEKQAPEKTLVTNSLWLLAATAIAVACSVAVEYIFGSWKPAEALIEERRMRYRALVAMFSLYAQGAEQNALHEASVRVARLAASGQSGMQRLYNSVVDRNLDAGSLPIGTRVRITMLAQLMDVSAAFGFQTPTAEDPELQKRCAQIASECKALLEDADMQHADYVVQGSGSNLTILDRVEGNLHVIASMPSDFSPERDKELVALPTKKIPLLIPGALKDRNTWTFGLKISLCATLCYILYFAVDWPGISTSVTTVLIAGLSTTGALKQRFAFRLLGAIVGGLIVGLGCTAFLFPEMDSITSLVVLVGFMAFISAWCAGGRLFSYMGLQIIFSFYLVAFEDFHAPTQLAPARDRLIGILLALAVMWVVFDQMWPVRTVTAMRRSFASILRSETELFEAELAAPEHKKLIEQTDALRDYVGKTMAAIRTMNDAVQYEFGVDRERHIETAEQILRAALTAVALLWNELSVLHKEDDEDFLRDPGLIEMRRKMASHLATLVSSVKQESRLQDAAHSPEPPLSFAPMDLLEHPRYGEYVQNSIARFRELETIVIGLEMYL